ncbi:MAG: dihydroorotate dehydrogenase [Candidatus Electryoneaceae bacterium]|nr:dihydroorotate dehydrogenase [Candidatus Electryoneaceae bacterium]
MSVDYSVPMGEMTLRTPLLTGSGTFGFGDEYRSLIDYSSFGGIVTKSISLEPRIGNPPNRICETSAGGLLNSIGLANPGVEQFITDKVSLLPMDLTKVFLSVVGNTVEEFIAVIGRLETVEGVSGYELNVSCPNVKVGGLDIGGDKEAVALIVREVRSVTDRFLSVKLTPNQPAIAPMAEVAAHEGADALTLTNTLIGMAVDAGRQRPMLGTFTGGYSGPPLKPVSLAKVWQASQVVDIPIWASGGIVTGLDGIEFILAGASALQLGSVLFADPYAPDRVLGEMVDYCVRHGVEQLSDLIGKLKDV